MEEVIEKEDVVATKTEEAPARSGGRTMMIWSIATIMVAGFVTFVVASASGLAALAGILAQ